MQARLCGRLLQDVCRMKRSSRNAHLICSG
jgi:hypothetical protein